MSLSPQPHLQQQMQQKRAIIVPQTCITCRVRKVRCDGRRDVCANCERLTLPCSYDEGLGGETAEGFAGALAINVPRRRVRRACISCHSKKARCSGSVPKCDRCKVQGLECIYRPGKRSLALPSTGIRTGDYDSDVAMHDGLAGQADPTNQTSSTSSPAAELSGAEEGLESLALRTFDSFFRHVHHIPSLSFLHRASLMERYRGGLLDRSLLLALVGITTLLTDLGPGTTEYGNRCIDEAVSLCMTKLEKPSILSLQALVIAIKHRILSRRFPGAFMLHAVACRLATALRLNHENPGLCFLARESRRRLMWSIYMTDALLAGGQIDYALWPDAEHQIQLQLPCNERNFEFDIPEPTESLRPPPLQPDGSPPPLPDDFGFVALHVRIQWMRCRVMQYSGRVLRCQTPLELSKLPASCAELIGELEAFEARLPLSFRWSESNVRLRMYSPRLGVFIMTHVWWRQCHLDLYRLFLAGLKDSLQLDTLGQQVVPDFVLQCRQRCYDHARAMADMFAQILALDNGMPVTDLDFPMCASQCARVLYHGLQTGGDAFGFKAESVREMATVCLRAARQATLGPACESIQADIEQMICSGIQLNTNPTSTRDTSSGGGAVMDLNFLDPDMDAAADEIRQVSLGVPVAAAGQPPPTAVVQAQAQTQMATRTPAGVDVDALAPFLPICEDPPPPPAATAALAEPPAASNATVATNASNAFEGEFQSDFDFGQEIFGLDSLTTGSASDWFGREEWLGE